jgi:hypothetical protein
MFVLFTSSIDHPTARSEKTGRRGYVWLPLCRSPSPWWCASVGPSLPIRAVFSFIEHVCIAPDALSPSLSLILVPVRHTPAPCTVHTLIRSVLSLLARRRSAWSARVASATVVLLLVASTTTVTAACVVLSSPDQSPSPSPPPPPRSSSVAVVNHHGTLLWHWSVVLYCMCIHCTYPVVFVARRRGTSLSICELRSCDVMMHNSGRRYALFIVSVRLSFPSERKRKIRLFLLPQ